MTIYLYVILYRQNILQTYLHAEKYFLFASNYLFQVFGKFIYSQIYRKAHHKHHIYLKYILKQVLSKFNTLNKNIQLTNIQFAYCRVYEREVYTYFNKISYFLEKSLYPLFELNIKFTHQE